jgi:hypothetical protein
VTMAQSALLRTNAKNIRIQAGKNVVLGVIDARTVTDRTNNTRSGQGSWGSVSVTAKNGGISEAVFADTAVNIYAKNVRLNATGSIGTTGSGAIETDMALVSAYSKNGGINLNNRANLTVGSVGPVTINRVGASGTLSPVSDSGTQSGLVKANGSLLNISTVNQSNIVNLPLFQVITRLTTTSLPNNYSGLYEQIVRISNPTGSSIDAVRIYIGNLPSGAIVANAVGMENGRYYIQYNQKLGAGQSVNLTIEYYVPNVKAMPVAPTFAVKVVPPMAAPVVSGTLLSAVRVTRLSNNRYVLDFASSLGYKYFIQYSDNNGTTWQTAIPTLNGTGGRIIWLDNGPTKTSSDPATVTRRSYRVFKAKL